MRKGALLQSLPIRLAVALLLLLVIAGFASAVVFGHRESRASARFDSSLWRHPAGYCTKSSRGRMVDDLVANHLRMGMRMSRVRLLLGRPDEVTADTVWFYNVSTEYSGFLATCVGLELDDSGGQLRKIRVTRDD
jgi:outer membrane protein assembly factor BamE (lipoprotein component of BamABCDE complex)